MSALNFTKMHGLGNDYLYIYVSAPLPAEPAQLSQILSRRRFAVGADGLILMEPSARADCSMRIFNADGSEAELCGNGLRCVAKYLFDRQIVTTASMMIETPAGIIPARILHTSPSISEVAVTLPEPTFEPSKVPVSSEEAFINQPLHIPDLPQYQFRGTALSLGNPHCVIFMETDIHEFPVAQVGPHLEHHSLFPNRTNVEFVYQLTPQILHVRVWERGSGETFACGSGACAAIAAGFITNKVPLSCTVKLTGGELKVDWQQGRGLILTGPAAEVYSGSISELYIEDMIS
ncbi:diaminopimelate epimerase [candidate division CSSED10-310 bacterium]|uniref:Diaminopimelate epimerase n=1 Tax=candidate division CSSED10-310 bacterium TaxID=2855610 RepID=A0ABV6YV00_UNCC1